MNLAKMAELDTRVDLRRRDRRVAEHFLDCAEVGASGQEMGGEAMPQGMRANVGVQTDRECVALDDLPQGDARK